jgi:16S rRNA A1518/A1519 N6-dimethyltransferase RsmA/KsgA/DIM1 with predicted DNA glycosylase/AP lyase activity
MLHLEKVLSASTFLKDRTAQLQIADAIGDLKASFARVIEIGPGMGTDPASGQR